MALPDFPRLAEFHSLMAARMPAKKARHCEGVAELLLEIGETIDLDPEASATAGLLHDIFRTWSRDELLAEATARGVAVDASARQEPILLHGPLAADYCARELGIGDDDVLEAITWHTTGTRGLGLLGQGLYLADFSEPNRKYAEAGEARRLFREQGFDAALRYVVEAKAALSQKKSAAHPHAEAFRAWVLEGRPSG